MPYTNSPKSTTPTKKGDEHTPNYAFGKENYILFAVGILLVVVGFVLMSGGASPDPNVYDPEVFSDRRITVAPLTVLAGFGIVAVAIMYKSKD